MPVATGRDLTAELQQQYPPAWSPQEPGAQIQGELFRYSKGPCRFGGEAWVAWIRTAEGSEWCLWLSSSVLSAEFRKWKPKVGEWVGVRFLGWGPDRKYRKFAVAVAGRQVEEPDFDTFAGPEPEPALGSYAEVTVAPRRPPAAVATRRAPAEACEEDPFSDE